MKVKISDIQVNVVRTKLTRQKLGEQFLRRKELYEMLHPETKALQTEHQSQPH